MVSNDHLTNTGLMTLSIAPTIVVDTPTTSNIDNRPGRTTAADSRPDSITLTGATCSTCGRPTDELAEVVSTHRTSRGVISYQRCLCGRLHVRLQRPLHTA